MANTVIWFLTVASIISIFVLTSIPYSAGHPAHLSYSHTTGLSWVCKAATQPQPTQWNICEVQEMRICKFSDP
jgi:hypothetical protein